MSNFNNLINGNVADPNLSVIRSLRFDVIYVKPLKETRFYEIRSFLDLTKYHAIMALRASSDLHAVMGDLLTVFSDWNMLRNVADFAIFRGRTSPVYQESREPFNILELATKSYEKNGSHLALETLNHKVVAPIVAAMIAHAASAYGIVTMPSQQWLGANDGPRSREKEDEVVTVLTLNDMRSVLLESTLEDLFGEKFPKPKGAGEMVLQTNAFIQYVRAISTYFVREASNMLASVQAFESACSYARHIMLFGPPYALNTSVLQPLTSCVNIAMDEAIGPAQPTATDLLVITPHLNAALSALDSSKLVHKVPADAFPGYYKRIQLKVDRSEGLLAPTFLIRNTPNVPLPGLKAAVHMYTPQFGIHSLTEVARVSEAASTVEADVTLATESTVSTLISLLAERKEFLGLLTNLTEKEMLAIAYCIATEVQFTPGVSAPTFLFRGPRLTEQTITLLADGPNFELSTTDPALVAAFATYEFGKSYFPSENSLPDALAAGNHSVEIIAQPDWKIVRRLGSTKVKVAAAHMTYEAKESPAEPGDELDVDDNLIPVVRDYTRRDYTGDLTLNATMGMEATYPIALLKAQWARNVELTRVSFALAMLAVASDDKELFKLSGVTVRSFRADPLVTSEPGETADSLVENWPADRSRPAVLSAMRDTFRLDLLRVIKSPTVMRGTRHVVRTGKGRDIMPMNIAEAVMYVELRINTVKGMLHLLYPGATSENPFLRLFNFVTSDAETMTWLANKVMLDTKQMIG